MGFVQAMADTRLQAMNLVHRAVLTLSGGRIGTTLARMPVYRVTTTGRRSGRPRTVMLTSPLRHDEAYVFVASKGGDARHPDWYRNLVAHPELVLEAARGGSPMALVARTATPEEKAELWPRIVAAHKGYAGYQRKTNRDIPVVLAEAPAS